MDTGPRLQEERRAVLVTARDGQKQLCIQLPGCSSWFGEEQCEEQDDEIELRLASRMGARLWCEP